MLLFLQGSRYVCVECGRTSVRDRIGRMVCCGLEMVSEIEILWSDYAAEYIKHCPITFRDSLIHHCVKHYKKQI
jgi:hypothetical protein